MTKPAGTIRLLALDVDGVLTDGSIIIDSERRETKVFCAQDGMGIKVGITAGLKVVFITSRNSQAVTIRAEELGVTDVVLGREDKINAVKEIADKYTVSLDAICYVGDDLIDLPAILNVGWGVTVPGASAIMQEKSDYVTQKPGGKGAVREIIEIILKSNGMWDQIIETYTNLDE